MSLEPEILGFEVSGECEWILLELEDGTTLYVKPYIGQVARVGYDPNTGAPVYAVGTSYQIRYVGIQKKSYSYPEFVKAKTDRECPWLEVKIEDGSVLRVKPNIVSVVRIGVDPVGIPQYMIQVQAAIQVVRIPREIIRKTSQRTGIYT